MRVTVGADVNKARNEVKVDENFQNVMRDLAGIPLTPESKKEGEGESKSNQPSPKGMLASPSMNLTSASAAKKAARQLRGFRTTFGQKKVEGEKVMTETEKALLQAKKEADEEEQRKEEEERRRKEAEEKDLAERKEVKEALEKVRLLCETRVYITHTG